MNIDRLIWAADQKALYRFIDAEKIADGRVKTPFRTPAC